MVDAFCSVLIKTHDIRRNGDATIIDLQLLSNRFDTQLPIVEKQRCNK